MKLVLDAASFHHLPKEIRAEGLEWAESVAPERMIRSVELLDEGRVRLFAITRGGMADHRADVVRVGGDLVLILRAIYTSSPPPPRIVAAMIAL